VVREASLSLITGQTCRDPDPLPRSFAILGRILEATVISEQIEEARFTEESARVFDKRREQFDKVRRHQGREIEPSFQQVAKLQSFAELLGQTKLSAAPLNDSARLEEFEQQPQSPAVGSAAEQQVTL
jgi:hypothetical protein